MNQTLRLARCHLSRQRTAIRSLLARLMERIAPSQPADLSWLDLRDGRRLPVRHVNGELGPDAREWLAVERVRHADISDEGRGQ